MSALRRRLWAEQVLDGLAVGLVGRGEGHGHV